MTNVKPATDAQIANLKELHAECDPVPCNILHLIARIDADREENARLKAERNALSGINREFAEEIAALKAEVKRLSAPKEIKPPRCRSCDGFGDVLVNDRCIECIACGGTGRAR